MGLAILGTLFSDRLFVYTFRVLNTLPLDKFFAFAKQWSSFFCFLFICVIVWKYDPKRRRYLMVLAVALILSTAANSIIKFVTCRARPKYGILMQPKEERWIKRYKEKHPESIISLWHRDHWYWLKPGRPLYENNYLSFPSGHANTAFVVSSFLSVLYPEGKVIWYIMAGGCAASRVESMRHYTEDVLFGGALGYLIAHLVFSWMFPVRMGERFTALLTRRRRDE
jgi:membrane-associated phospholipid phosphatase